VGEAGALEPVPEQQLALKQMRKLRWHCGLSPTEGRRRVHQPCRGEERPGGCRAQPSRLTRSRVDLVADVTRTAAVTCQNYA
jgi:hypothetical protein